MCIRDSKGTLTHDQAFPHLNDDEWNTRTIRAASAKVGWGVVITPVAVSVALMVLLRVTKPCAVDMRDLPQLLHRKDAFDIMRQGKRIDDVVREEREEALRHYQARLQSPSAVAEPSQADN